MKSIWRASVLAVSLAAVASFTACGDDDDSSQEPAAGADGGASETPLDCSVLGELCHEADTGSGLAHDCHELGHDGVIATCAKQFDGCISACVTESDASQQDPRCAALGELCHEVDDGDGPLHDCHELGHDGNAAACASGFEDCATRCLVARAALEAAAGGAGGAGPGDAAAGAGGLASGGAPSAAGAGGVEAGAGGSSSGGAP